MFNFSVLEVFLVCLFLTKHLANFVNFLFSLHSKQIKSKLKYSFATLVKEQTNQKFKIHI